jgi:hypothetical protein
MRIETVPAVVSDLPTVGFCFLIWPLVYCRSFESRFNQFVKMPTLEEEYHRDAKKTRSKDEASQSSVAPTAIRGIGTTRGNVG